jgi:ATP-dependent 26S proteasome regulatory subunit
LEILHILTAHTPLGDCVDLQFLARATEFFSGADLGSLCREVSNLLSVVVFSGCCSNYTPFLCTNEE